MFCLVQNPKQWLRLVKYHTENKKLLMYYLPRRIPHEYEDIRFKRAIGYLHHGWKFYIERPNHDYEIASPIKVPSEVIEQIEQELLSPVQIGILPDEVLRDIHQWMMKYPLLPEERGLNRAELKQAKTQNTLNELFNKVNGKGK